MPLIGYARVSTDEQDTSAQLGELQRVGCATIFEDRASGGSRSRPKLASALAAVGQGDTLVVVRIDRLARSLSHLLEMVEGLRAKGAYFRSINDPIDTSSPQGMLMTQMLHIADSGVADALMMIGDPEYYGRFFGFTAEATSGWHLPGPVERHRLLARIRRCGGVATEGVIEPDLEPLRLEGDC